MKIYASFSILSNDNTNVHIMNQIHAFDNKVLKGFNVLNSKLQKLIEENQKWIEKEWNELEKKWNKWNSQEIVIFIGHTLKCKNQK
ncbi:hypothetical protein RFI_34253 [Reticulomyxa filosa]|uniref:Uncharacterized protein n=1 Tax=Reticulomyxa filosa TaxID=46433 RepID=X6LP39_RETFI|nr:hypothetical protein RFI_34253 [Reticulomyxa filosa]|eukprot:ETO03156.1 hypothetical protein RFI_34253 [Reticulomyxa filosa]